VDHITDAAWGFAEATVTDDGQVLDAWYRAGSLGLGAPPPARPLSGNAPGAASAAPAALVIIESLADPPTDTLDVYLRLHLLSHRKIRPHQANLDRRLRPAAERRLDLGRPVRARAGRRAAGRAAQGRPAPDRLRAGQVPRMIDYVVPSGVRIADADRVRLGAHLAPGTTVMHEGFVNYNAGTLGASMVEGRISAGVVVGDGSDVGGGASIMGTLSGGARRSSASASAA
jgi:2,3,4,5-tetrahydropyridine-2-carboxylate N-succinyltransferase